MMSALQDVSSDFSRTHPSSEDIHTSATTPEPDENDRVTSTESDEENDGSESELTDDASIASYDSDFPDEYIIHDHEATLTVTEATESGPLSLDFPATSSALTTENQNAYPGLPELVKLEIAALLLLPKDQTIRLIWNHDARVWIYRGNEIPFVQSGFPGLGAAAKDFLHRAPCLYTQEYDLLVHYPTADFSFEYNRCGSRTEDDDEYLEAMQHAARIVGRHNNQSAHRRIRNLTLSWCPRHDDPGEVLQHLASIPGLERVDLGTHAHYRRGTSFDFNLRIEEEASDQWHVKNSLGHYPFEVRMFNHWGVQLGEDEDEDEDEW